MASTLSTRNVQAMIPAETHKVLREYAYGRNEPLKDIVCEILMDFVDKVQKESQLKRTLNAP